MRADVSHAWWGTRVGVWLLCVCFIALAGCAPRWQKPDVSVANVELVGGNFFEQRFRLSLRVHNPNDRDIVLQRLTFEMVPPDAGKGASATLASGGTEQRTVVQRNGDTLVEVDARSHLLELLESASRTVDSTGKVHYRLRGAADIEGYGMVPFDHAVELDASRWLRRGG